MNWQKKLEDRSIEVMQSKKQRLKEQNLRKIWNTIKHTHICMMGEPEEEKEAQIFEEIIAKKFPNLLKTLTYFSRKLI